MIKKFIYKLSSIKNDSNVISIKNLIKSEVIYEQSIKNETKDFVSRILYNINQKNFKLKILDIYPIFSSFRNFLPFFFKILFKRSTKILVIGNTFEISALFESVYIRRFKNRIFIYRKPWMNGFLTNFGKFKIIQIKNNRNGYPMRKSKISLSLNVKRFKLIILLKEINNCEIEILKSMIKKRIPIIYINNTSMKSINYFYSTYTFIMDTHKLNTFFLFLYFLEKNFKVYENDFNYKKRKKKK